MPLLPKVGKNGSIAAPTPLQGSQQERPRLRLGNATLMALPAACGRAYSQSRGKESSLTAVGSMGATRNHWG